MKQIIDDIYNLTLKATSLVSKGKYKGIVEDDVDKLAETVELLNDLYEVLYDNVFEDTSTICEGTSDQL